MVQKVKSFFRNERNTSKLIFTILVLTVFGFIFGPSVYAQFLRQDGTQGWGYGNGFGYGVGYGFDSGAVYGNKTVFTSSSANAYGVGFGFGYLPSTGTLTVGSDLYYTVPTTELVNVAPVLFTFAGSNPAFISSMTSAENINLTTSNSNGTIHVLIPNNTIIQKNDNSFFDITSITAADQTNGIFSTSIDANAVVDGAAEFGLRNQTLYFSKPITVAVPVTSSLEGQVLDIIRSPNSGSTWETLGLTSASTDSCDISGNGSAPTSTAVVSGGLVKIHTCRASYFAVYSIGTPPHPSTPSAQPVGLTLSPITTSSLQVNWSSGVGGGETQFAIQGSQDNSHFSTVSTTPTTTHSIIISNATIPGLPTITPNTLFYFRVVASSTGSEVPSDYVFDYTSSTAPVSLVSSNITTSTLTLTWNGNGNDPATIYQIYGDNGFATTTVTVATTTNLQFLNTGTTYTFNIRAQNFNNPNTYSNATSIVVATMNSVPTVITNAASDISTSSVTLNGIVSSLGGLLLSGRGFDYGTSTNYGSSGTVIGSDTNAFLLGVNSEAFVFTPGTPYHYRAYATNASGTAYGLDSVFVTVAAPTTNAPTTTVTSDNTATTTISVSSDVVNAAVDLLAVTSGSTTTLPGAIVANISTTLGAVELDMPIGTEITASGSWNGILTLPTVQSNSSITNAADSGYTATVSGVVEVGFGDVSLNLSKAARILIPGMAGKLAGYSRGGVFIKITSTCSDDTQSTNDLLASNSECKIDAGRDLVIWTKHFTKFAAYTQTQNNNNNNNGGGSSGGGTYYNPVVTSNITSTAANSITSSNVPTLLGSEAQNTSNTAAAPVVSNLESKVVIAPPSVMSYQPGAVVKYSYQYKNESVKKVTLKFVRQMLDSKGKVVFNTSANKTIKAGATFSSDIVQSLAKTIKPGEYTIRIQVIGVKNKVLAENSFKIVTEKLKKKYLSMTSEVVDTKIIFDIKNLSRYKSGTVLPINLQLKYNYLNNTAATQKIKIVRKLVDGSGKELEVNTGKITVKAGKISTQTFIQKISDKMSEGSYAILIKMYDQKTGALLGESSLELVVVYK